MAWGSVLDMLSVRQQIDIQVELLRKWLATEVWSSESRSPPEIRFKQSQHLDGFKVLRLNKISKWGCVAREENDSDTELWGSVKREGKSHL